MIPLIRSSRRECSLATGGGFAGLQVDAEAVLVAAVELAHNNADLVLVADRMELLDVGDRGRFERALFQHPSVVGLDVAGVNAESTGLESLVHEGLLVFKHVSADKDSRQMQGVWIMRAKRSFSTLS